jgi:hypothetical protein
MLHFIPQIAWHVSPIRITLQFVAARSISSYTSLMNYRAKFHTTWSARACIACQDSKLKRKGEFRNTHKAKGHQLCNGQQSAHTLCLCHKRKVSQYTVRIRMTSGPVLHVRTQNLKERKEFEHSQTKRTPKVQWSAVSTQPMTPRS